MPTSAVIPSQHLPALFSVARLASMTSCFTYYLFFKPLVLVQHLALRPSRKVLTDDGRMDGWMDGWMTDRWMIDGWVDDGWMGRWMDGWILDPCLNKIAH